MSTLRIERLVKRFGGVPAVNGISFQVRAGEFVSLLGPSGCGKTTTLRCIAGFEDPDGGRILLDGEVLVDAAEGQFTRPNKRHFGMVFQSYAVWPHMTVFENVAYPLRVKRAMSRAELQERVNEKLRSVGLADFGQRYPNQLSGGQQQRVALARALVMEPRALLFDEPLSNLDAKLRERMRFELIELQSKLAVPAVYVTHDQSEAMVMSKQVIVMERGDIAQVGPPDEIYARPSTEFVADFIGLGNFIDAEVLSAEGTDLWLVRCAFGELRCASDRSLTKGEKVLVMIRPERVQIATSGFPGPNAFLAQLRNSYFLGPHHEYFLRLGGATLRAQSGRAVAAAGDEVHIRLDPADCRVLPKGDARSPRDPDAAAMPTEPSAPAQLAST
jgi:ABC-type Fe3+/spermidine/putrescine transport system ATPase subunit